MYHTRCGPLLCYLMHGIGYELLSSHTTPGVVRYYVACRLLPVSIVVWLYHTRCGPLAILNFPILCVTTCCLVIPHPVWSTAESCVACVHVVVAGHTTPGVVRY